MLQGWHCIYHLLLSVSQCRRCKSRRDCESLEKCTNKRGINFKNKLQEQIFKGKTMVAVKKGCERCWTNGHGAAEKVMSNGWLDTTQRQVGRWRDERGVRWVGMQLEGRERYLKTNKKAKRKKSKKNVYLPGSVGISEPSFAMHLQPLTRCHWSKNNHAGHPSISSGMGNTIHTLSPFYMYTIHSESNKHANIF